MNYKTIIDLINSHLIRKYRKSYSQCGEDLIVDFIFNALKINKPTYLDIGAYHPVHLSNTYYFYKKGSHGVLIEPNPYLYKKIARKRKRDICLNSGIGTEFKVKADFYIMSSETLSTFSKEEAERYRQYGNQKIERIIQVPMITINKIIKDNFTSCPNFISMDVEGLDFEILKSFDFNKYRPEIFCIETLTYTENKSEIKLTDISKIMIDNNYIAYADTYINTIFVEKNIWANRQ